MVLKSQELSAHLTHGSQWLEGVKATTKRSVAALRLKIHMKIFGLDSELANDNQLMLSQIG